MSIDRRSFLRGAAVVGAAATATASEARERPEAPADAVGMLYDTTRCIGCKACVVACKDANGMAADTSYFPERTWDAPLHLNASTRNIIKLYKEGDEYSYMKQQCMHCVDPACVSACMIGAYKKREYGVVTWDGSKCVGCRYCTVACPYNIPRMEWDSPVPLMVKCEMCSHRLVEGLIPACCDVCPVDAVIFGKYEDLLADARNRLSSEPDRYIQEIYGDQEIGGTQVLYVSHVPFEKLGLPPLGPEPVPELSQSIQHGLYQGFILPAVLYAGIAAAAWRSRRRARDDEEEGGAS